MVERSSWREALPPSAAANLAEVARGMMGGAAATAWPRPLPDAAYPDLD